MIKPYHTWKDDIRTLKTEKEFINSSNISISLDNSLEKTRLMKIFKESGTHRRIRRPFQRQSMKAKSGPKGHEGLESELGMMRF